MLAKLYASKTDKELKTLLHIYTAVIIVCIVLPLLFIAIGYFLHGKIEVTSFKLLIVVIPWSAYNADYLNKRLKSQDDKKP